MKYLYIKNKKLNKQYFENELNKILYHNIVADLKLPTYVRQNIIRTLQQQNNTTKTARNRCYLTNKSRSVNNYFKISRIKLRFLISNNHLNAVKKSS